MAKAKAVEENQEVEVPTSIIGFDTETKQILRDLATAMASRPAPIINLSSVDSTVLEKLVAALSTNSLKTPEKVTRADVEEIKKTMQPKAKPEPEETSVSLTQIREVISSKVAENKTTAIVALLAKHGAKNASTLEEDQFASFYSNLLKL